MEIAESGLRRRGGQADLLKVATVMSNSAGSSQTANLVII